MTRQHPQTGFNQLTPSAGFTLLEVLVALVMVTLLLALALPSFEGTLERNRQSNSLNDAIALLSLARTEAVTRATAVSACASANVNDPNSADCSGANSWETGWLVFEDDGPGGLARNGQRDPNEALVRSGPPAARDITVRASSFPTLSAITFDESGMASGRGTLVVCDSRGAANARAIVVNISGQTRLAVDDTGDGVVDDDAGASVSCP